MFIMCQNSPRNPRLRHEVQDHTHHTRLHRSWHQSAQRSGEVLTAMVMARSAMISLVYWYMYVYIYIFIHVPGKP